MYSRVVTLGAAKPWSAQSNHAVIVGAISILVLMAALLVLGASRSAKNRRLSRGLRSVLAGGDNRLSTSKTMVLAWTVVVAWMLASVALYDLAANVPLGDLPVSNDYLLLLGGPFASAVLAKQIVLTRLANGTISKPPAPDDAPLKVGDLVSSDAGDVDLVDLQYTTFNLIALAIVIWTFLNDPSRGLPAVPSGLLAVTSAAALTYVGNKAVTSATPAIARFTPSVVRPGQPTMLGGSNLMATATGAADPTVTIGGAPAPVIGAPSPSSVSVRVPMGITTVAGGQQTPVTLVADPSGSATATSSVMVVPDAVTLTDVTPSGPAPGALVVLHGAGFLDANAVQPAEAGVPVDPPVVVFETAADGKELARVTLDGTAAVAPTDSELRITMPALNVGAFTQLRVSVARGTLTSTKLPLLMGAGSPAPAPAAPALTPKVIDARATGVTYGSGVFTLNGEMLTSAVTFDAPTATPAFESTTSITLCTSREEVYTALGITVDTQASYGMASVSNKFSWAQSKDIITTDLVLVVRASVTSAPLALGNPALTSDARTVLESGDTAGFVRRFGDRFVSAMVLGGEYIGLLTIQTRTEQDKLTIADTLSASADGGEFSGSVQTSVTSTLNQYSDQLNLRCFVYQQGGGTPAGGGAPTPDAIMEAVLDFRNTVTADNAYPLQASLSDYGELALPNPQAWLDAQDGLTPARQHLLLLWTSILQMQCDLQQVQYVLDNTDLFIEPATQLTASMQTVQSQLQSAISTATQAATDYVTAVLQQGTASLVAPPTAPAEAPISWPTLAPIPAFRLLHEENLALALSVPVDGDPNGQLVFEPADGQDPAQQFQITSLTQVPISLINVKSGLMMTRTADSNKIVQSSNTDTSVQWRPANAIPDHAVAYGFPAPTSVAGPPGTTTVYDWVMLESVACPGDFLDADGGTPQAGSGLITWNHASSHVEEFRWQLVLVPDSLAPAPAMTSTVISLPAAW